MKTFSIIGCGAVGKTVGRLLHRSGTIELRDVLTRSIASAQAAAGFIGAGRPLAGFGELQRADLYLVASSDDAIAACVEGLVGRAGLLDRNTTVCHFSGALGSEVLSPAAALGAQVASVHPVKSFADPAVCVGDFAGTWCGIEGDPQARELLGELFGAIGGKIFTLDPRFKTLYHTGSVLVCNYLTALMEAGLRAYQKGGVPRETALQVMEPLVRGTVDNVFRVGTAQALTGPIARGDAGVVARQLEALDDFDEELARIYRALGGVALKLSRERGQAQEPGLAAIERLLTPGTPGAP
ncbi:Rossmann-like and DUF2520 domain-containing protein [Geomonas subterranea]|uniref:DUF2520 domain-containing protein n=1 Tax=Geomonas subterranea TaxID=2847989 RepID=A0ABX8LPM7_9BACT|nr:MULTISPECIES: Rossmann-like and DUF2520 domain-containing protein [Geomonas]QXE92941.1 DUF2520 domain-containing protein [Geomonas subterranea]QXM08953.1 DUF2520 domain-containing protein [Geomonas subterranea]